MSDDKLTFSSLRIGDLQVAVCGLEALPAHNLPFKLTEGDMEPIESDCVVVQFGRKLIMNTRHFFFIKLQGLKHFKSIKQQEERE